MLPIRIWIAPILSKTYLRAYNNYMASEIRQASITLFRSKPPRNAVIDYLEKCLKPFDLYSSGITTYSFKTPSLRLDNFRIELSDAYSIIADSPSSGAIGKPAYMGIHFSSAEGSGTYYYFIDTFERVSNTVARLSATMDVLNTYFQNKDVYGTAPKVWSGISLKSRISRLIVDRYKDIGLSNPASVIDAQPENINPAQFMKGEPVTYSASDIPQTYIKGREPDGWVLLIATINKDDRIPTALILPRWEQVDVDKETWETDNAIIMNRVSTDHGESFTNVRLLSYNDIDLTCQSIVAVYSLPSFPGLFASAASELTYFDVSHTFKCTLVNGSTSKLILPLQVSELGAVYGFGYAIALNNGLDNYAVEGGASGNLFVALQHNEKMEAYKASFNSDDTLATSLSSIYIPALKGAGSRSESDVRYLTDPKIYNSEFTKWKFIYDNSSLDIRFEEYESKGSPSFINEVYYSLSFSGQFYFKIDITGADRKFRTSPFDNILQLSRSNKEAIYTSDYWNYMRNGYNFDVKSKSLQDASSWIGVATGFMSTLGSAGVAAATGNIFAGAQAIGSAGSTLNSISGAILGNIQRQNSIDQKIATASASGVQVKDLSSNDLFRTYQGSEFPILCKFEPRAEIKSLLDDLFYFYGYARSETLRDEQSSFEKFREITLESRHWFNYVEMAIEWKTDDYYLDDNILQEIANKFAQGVTIFHIGNDGTFDLEQTKENYERWLLE